MAVLFKILQINLWGIGIAFIVAIITFIIFAIIKIIQKIFQ